MTTLELPSLYFSFVLGYLRMILCEIATAISIKHRILATFNKKKINSDSLYAFKQTHRTLLHNNYDR